MRQNVPMADKPKKRKTKEIVSDEQIAAALAEFRGNVSAAAKRLGLPRTSVERRIHGNEDLEVVLLDARETMLDFAESALFAAVLAGKSWAIQFYLKCQGKKRGYVEKQQFEIGDMLPTEVQEEVIATREA